ncbi:hypothetical protein GE061_017039 [Apolygus lucorum]|uniref:Uncharacterized protein n=1 Tax=Apolygus lucorum TaxID=248454 RepID=A0A6A4JM78_APOLU|nr:hypothetical protein GE061_017039 [Apolygus lucorum]
MYVTKLFLSIIVVLATTDAGYPTYRGKGKKPDDPPLGFVVPVNDRNCQMYTNKPPPRGCGRCIAKWDPKRTFVIGWEFCTFRNNKYVPFVHPDI